MRIELHPDFRRSYKNRIAKNPKLVKKTAERIKLFQNDPGNPQLRDHPLKGSKNHYRSFSITGDLRVVNKLTGDRALFYDIGSHNQVY